MRNPDGAPQRHASGSNHQPPRCHSRASGNPEPLQRLDARFRGHDRGVFRLRSVLERRRLLARLHLLHIGEPIPTGRDMPCTDPTLLLVLLEFSWYLMKGRDRYRHDRSAGGVRKGSADLKGLSP
jgi:hypothetical protein